MRKPARFVIAAFAMATLAPVCASGAADCPPADWHAQRLATLKSAQFQIPEVAQRQKLAIGLLSCLADPDPALRDGIAFEAYSTWLRANQLDEATRLGLLEKLLPMLAGTPADAAGFRQPFAALVLSELARADRKTPFLSTAQRAGLLDAGASYVQTVSDYRGYDSVLGWRHGVAHGSDLLMQLALNPALDKPQLDRILAAIARQVAPSGGEHFYIYGEPARMARPVLFVAMRGLHSPEEWDAWFRQVASPAPLASWREGFSSQTGLAKRHNTREFLLNAYAEIRDSKDAQLATLVPAVTSALAAVP